jgi:hypothetical protein
MPHAPSRPVRRLSPQRHAVALVVLVIGSGLWLDGNAGFMAQTLIGVCAWAAALAMLGAAEGAMRTRMLACLALATAGELFLSLVWGLYDYRLYNVPFFVPPGHLLLMLAGMQIARRRLPESFAHATAAIVVGWAAYALWRGDSTLDVFLAALLVVCIATARHADDRRLYAVMLWLALVLELYGTAIGNWSWRPVEPWFGLTSLNPPLAAGAFYAALDALSLAVARAAHRAPGEVQAQVAWARRG